MLTAAERALLDRAHVRREQVDWHEERQAVEKLAAAMELVLIGRGRQ
jgi:hypothetical protein